MEVRRVSESYHTLERVDSASYHHAEHSKILRFLSESLIPIFKGW